MRHQYPEIEAAIRGLAVNFSAGNIALPELAAALHAIADNASDVHRRDPLRRPTEIEAHVLRNISAGNPPDAGVPLGSNVGDAILDCRDAEWLSLRGDRLTDAGVDALKRA